MTLLKLRWERHWKLLKSLQSLREMFIYLTTTLNSLVRNFFKKSYLNWIYIYIYIYIYTHIILVNYNKLIKINMVKWNNWQGRNLKCFCFCSWIVVFNVAYFLREQFKLAEFLLTRKIALQKIFPQLLFPVSTLPHKYKEALTILGKIFWTPGSSLKGPIK